jgi:hypothetical protein
VAGLVTITAFGSALGAYYSLVLLDYAFVLFWAVQLMFKPYAMLLVHRTSLASWACLCFTTSVASSLFTFDVAAPPAYGTVMGPWGCWCMQASLVGACSACTDAAHYRL